MQGSLVNPESRILIVYLLTGWLLTIMNSCGETSTQNTPVSQPPFVSLPYEQTGLNFRNNLTQTLDFNILHYMYFFNGGGVGTGDFNNDGLVDIYFTANQLPNKLFLNRGNMNFEDVTAESGTAGKGMWSTGVSVVDINHDGLLDIYVSQVGNYRSVKGANELFVCQEINNKGVPVYEDKASEYGLDLVGFGTQASFFDFDLDGDLDMYQLNHSLHQNGTFGQRRTFDEPHPLAGDRLFRNDLGKFTDITTEAGIHSSVIGYGLGIATSDINLDGYPDIYIANDFHENDYLYINNQDGTFTESLTNQIRHTSRYSMGVDIGDLNNDGLNDIFTLDMHPEDPRILKSSMSEEDYGVFLFKLGYGYNHQYARNNLQLNNGNNTFSEIGTYAGVYASDWSWATLLMDFNNDGARDIFVSNGIPKRMNDLDYISFLSSNEVRYRINMDVMEESDLNIIEKMPEIRILNKFWVNQGNLQFDDYSELVTGNSPGYSNGAAYADFDNDGDLDIVVNNINDFPFLYENKANELYPSNHYLQVSFEGPESNKYGIGCKVIVQSDQGMQLYENFPVRGYQSSVQPMVHAGLGYDREAVKSITVVWPDQRYQTLDRVYIDTSVVVYYNDAPESKFDYNALRTVPNTALISDVTNEMQLNYSHAENGFVEFNREQLIPHMTSTEGPALAVGDLNGDGLDDLFFGSGKHQHNAVYLQGDNKFYLLEQPGLMSDSTAEIVDAEIADVNNDGFPDVLTATGGNEWFNNADWQRPRIYLNNGEGVLYRDTGAFSNIFVTASCLETCDLNNDGFVDCFIGARAMPWQYGIPPTSYLMLNDGQGNFSDVTSEYAPDLSGIGLVRDALWLDLDNDGDQDLLLALEWGVITAFIRNGSHFYKHQLDDAVGWWNYLLPADYDGDGDIDFIAGNLGLNSKLKASADEPLRMYVNDFDDNGQIEQAVTHYIDGKEVILPMYAEVMKQMPSLKKRYLFAGDYARASVEEVFGAGALAEAIKYEATELASSIYINNGNLEFERRDLPQRLQYSRLQAGVNYDFNDDGLIDVLLVGNYHENYVELGRQDADYGTITINEGGELKEENIQLLDLEGQFRQARTIVINGETYFILARNDGPASIYKASSAKNQPDTTPL